MRQDSVAARQRFFSKQAHMQAWKDSMSGENEDRIISILEQVGFVLDKDYIRQHPIGERFVIDFAFVPEQIAIEVDGKDHDAKQQRVKDKRRDSYLRTINWVPIRIREEHLTGPIGSFYKSLIKEVVKERREMWRKGILYPVDFPNYVEADF